MVPFNSRLPTVAVQQYHFLVDIEAPDICRHTEPFEFSLTVLNCTDQLQEVEIRQNSRENAPQEFYISGRTSGRVLVLPEDTKTVTKKNFDGGEEETQL